MKTTHKVLLAAGLVAGLALASSETFASGPMIAPGALARLRSGVPSERGEDGCCRAQTRRSPQTCCPQTCFGAQALRALTGFVDWIFAARSRRTAVWPARAASHTGGLPRGFGYRHDFRRSAHEASLP